MRPKKASWESCFVWGSILVLVSYALPFAAPQPRDIGDLFGGDPRTWYLTDELRIALSSIHTASPYPQGKSFLFGLIWLGIFAPPAMLALLALRQLRKLKHEGFQTDCLSQEKGTTQTPQPKLGRAMQVAWSCMFLGFFLTFGAFLLGLANHHNQISRIFWFALRLFPPLPLFLPVWWYRQQTQDAATTPLRDIALLAGLWSYAPFLYAPIDPKLAGQVWHLSLGPWLMSAGLSMVCLAAWRAEQQRAWLPSEDAAPFMHEAAPWIGFCEELGLPTSKDETPLPPISSQEAHTVQQPREKKNVFPPFQRAEATSHTIPSLHSLHPASSWPAFSIKTKS